MKNNQITTEQSLDDVLMSFRQNMTTSLLEEAKETGFSLSHFEILGYIADKGNVTMKEIALWLHITPPSASALVDVLVKKKLVSRVLSNKDRRSVHIKLEEKSHKLFHKIYSNKMSIFKKMLSRLDNKDKEDLIRVLTKCISN